MTEVQDLRAQAQEAYRSQSWLLARARLSALDVERPLGASDLARLATAEYLTGRHAAWEAAMARAHRTFLDDGDPEQAGRCAFWLGLTLLVRGEQARGGGWLMRAQRLAEDEVGPESVVAGYLAAAEGYRHLDGDDPAAAHEAFGRAVEAGMRLVEPDLVALGRLGCGQACVALGDPGRAAHLFDEVMVDVHTGDVSPIPAGLIYCAVILACQELFDLRRAQEWTAALSDWCAGQPELVPFSCQCLVHRSELAQLRGDWLAAVGEAELACRRLSDLSDEAAGGMAFYQRGELHRLRGEHALAESAFEKAGKRGRSPHPGLALLRLAQGRHEAAAQAIRQADTRVGEAPTRSELLGARVEIMLAAGARAEARAAAAELAELAAGPAGPLVHPIAAQASGAVLLDEGDAEAALSELRGAFAAWQELRAPYQAARVRVLVARCLQLLGDRDTAAVELAAARETFGGLGARPDLDRLSDQASGTRDPSPLTPREVRVVGLLARGMTNRQIAEELAISEKTVARHVHNILTKCDLPNRAAATAYAYTHDLL